MDPGSSILVGGYTPTCFSKPFAHVHNLLSDDERRKVVTKAARGQRQRGVVLEFSQT